MQRAGSGRRFTLGVSPSTVCTSALAAGCDFDLPRWAQHRWRSGT